MSVRALPPLGTVVLGAALLVGCARMGAPTGGPEDRIPPMVVSIEPDTFAVIEPTRDPVKIRFSERISERPVGGVTLNEVVQISPTTSGVRVKHGRSTLEVSLVDGFEAGIVYRVTVLPLIQDRFGNPMRDAFEYSFSTGPDFEANVVAGVVTDRLTGEPVRSIRVDAVAWEEGATPPDTSGPEGERGPPAYTAVTDSLGIFAIRYLPSAHYRLVAFEDQNRNSEADFRERQDEGEAFLRGPADTVMPLFFELLQPDTTPAVLARAEVVDSLFLRLDFDDYLDPEDEFRTVAARFEPAEGFEDAEGPLPLQERVLQEHVYPVYRDSLMAWADSVAAARADSIARLQADSIAVARADSLAAAGLDPEALDTTVVDTTGGAAGVEPELPTEVIDPGAGLREREAEPEEPLPQQSLVVALRRPLLPAVVYRMTVVGVTNIARVPGGGGEVQVVWEPPDTATTEPPDSLPPDTAAVRPDTTETRPDSIPPDTTVVEPPGSAPPDTTAVAPRRGAALSPLLLRPRRRLPVPASTRPPPSPWRR